MPLSRVALYERAAVASEQPLASLAGYDALRAGGSAFDAAVAVSFTLAVVFHPAGGLGGDFFAMAYEAKSDRVHCLNSSGWSPSGLSPDLVLASGEKAVPVIGPFSAMVPGFIAGVLALHGKFGKLDASALLARPLEYAREGFPAGPSICRSIRGNLDSLGPTARSIFAPGGRAPSPGDWIRQERLGNVIEDVSKGGAPAFYDGWPAEAIAKKLTDLGVAAKKGDFSEFRPEWVEPLSLDYRGTTVYEVPPNSMGATSLLMLKQLSAKELGKVGPLSRERFRATMEAAEVAYERKERMLGDPRFGRIDMEEFMRLGGPSKGGGKAAGGGDTTAFSVADGEGNVVSGIQSLFHHFGSRVFVEDCGMMLNSRGAGFRMAGPNKVGPRKRPVHTLSALLLRREGEAPTAVGCSGGDYRPMQHALFVTNLVDYSMSLEDAVDHPRFLWSGGREVLVEEGYDASGLGYDVSALSHPGTTGVCQAVQTLVRSKKAVCDVRGDGMPAGC